MVEVKFDIKVEGTADEEPLLDEYELDMMLEHTKGQINRHVQRSLGDLRCEEHDEPPVVTVSGTYALETEQLDISYNIDTCCKPFLLQAIMLLNRR